MKLSGILLASIITSAISTSAQDIEVTKDSIITKNNIEIGSNLITRDSSQLDKNKRTQDLIIEEAIKEALTKRANYEKAVRKALAKRANYKYCPGCGRG